MNSSTVYFSSITHALKVNKQISKLGILGKVIKFSDAKRNDGCGYGLSFPETDYFSVVKVLKESGVPYTFSKNDIS